MGEVIFSASPHDTYRPFRRKRRERQESWVAPEHKRAASYMQRAFPVAHDGRRMTELGRELVLDARPEIMQPKRQPIFLGLDK